MKKISLADMLKQGVHFGHRTSKRHPKMSEYIFQSKSGIHVIDLEKTTQELEKALNYIKKIVSEGKTIVFVGTKWQAKQALKKAYDETGMPYITERWIGGTLTNYDVIARVITNYKRLKKEYAAGEWEQKYTKKEQSKLKHLLDKLETKVGGIAELNKIPDAIFVIDIKNESIAVAEARKKKIPIVAICDTNVNPELVDYPIPANDDALRSVELIVSLAAEAVKEGLAELAKNPPKPDVKPKVEKKPAAKKATPKAAKAASKDKPAAKKSSPKKSDDKPKAEASKKEEKK